MKHPLTSQPLFACRLNWNVQPLSLVSTSRISARHLHSGTILKELFTQKSTLAENVLFWLCLLRWLYTPPMMIGVLPLPLCSGALGPHLLLDQSRHLVTLSAPSTGPPTSLPLGSQSSAGGSSTLSKKRAPPPPPGHKRTLSDPPSPVLQGPQSKGASRWQHLRFVTAETTFRRHLCWQKRAKSCNCVVLVRIVVLLWSGWVWILRLIFICPLQWSDTLSNWFRALVLEYVLMNRAFWVEPSHPRMLIQLLLDFTFSSVFSLSSPHNES